MDPLSLIVGGIGGLGGLFHGITGFFAANAQAKADQVAAQQANMDAGVNAQEKLIQGNQAAASGAVRAAANGGGLVGSAIGVIQQLSSNAMFNAKASIYRGRTEAQSDLYQASVAKTNALTSLIGGGMSAAGSVLGGFQQSSLLSTLRAGASGAYAGGGGFSGADDTAFLGG